MAQSFFSYWGKTIFQLKVTVTLTFDLLTSYSIGVVFYWSCPSCIPSMKFLGPSILQLLSGNHFSHKSHCDLTAQGHCDLAFRPTELKNNRDLPLGMANLHTKYRVPGPKRSSDSERKPFFSSQGHRDLDLWPFDLKINRGLLLVMTNLHTKYEVIRPKRSSVIERKQVWQTDGRTDGRTGQKQYVSPRRGET